MIDLRQMQNIVRDAARPYGGFMCLFERSNTFIAAIAAAKYWKEQIRMEYGSELDLEDPESIDVYDFSDDTFWNQATPKDIEGLIDEHLLPAIPKKYQGSHLFWLFFFYITGCEPAILHAKDRELVALGRLQDRIETLRNWDEGFVLATGINWPANDESLAIRIWPFVKKEASKISDKERKDGC
jgi:hypothetical protein